MVTVIIPNYNHAKFLIQRIESVLSQTYQDFEIIILDDCSSDNSRDIIEQYRYHPKVNQIVFNEQNSGSVFKQWEKGIQLAKGEYIWIAESDDYADTVFVERLLAILESNPMVGLAYSNSHIILDNGNQKGLMSAWKNERYNTRRWDFNFINNGQDELREFLSDNCTINNASAVLFKKAVLCSGKVIDSTFRYAGDWMVYIRISADYDIGYIADSLNFYRDHSNNASKKSELNGEIYFERVCCLSEAYKGLKDINAKEKALKGAAAAYIDVLYNCLKVNPSKKRLMSYIKRLMARNFYLFLRIQAKAFFILLSKIL